MSLEHLWAGWRIPYIEDADAQSRRRRRNVVLLEAEEVIGTVQKPEIELFLARQNLNSHDRLELRESFLPKIIESVETNPF